MNVWTCSQASRGASSHSPFIPNSDMGILIDECKPAPPCDAIKALWGAECASISSPLTCFLGWPLVSRRSSGLAPLHPAVAHQQHPDTPMCRGDAVSADMMPAPSSLGLLCSPEHLFCLLPLHLHAVSSLTDWFFFFLFLLLLCNPSFLPSSPLLSSQRLVSSVLLPDGSAGAWQRWSQPYENRGMEHVVLMGEMRGGWKQGIAELVFRMLMQWAFHVLEFLLLFLWRRFAFLIDLWSNRKTLDWRSLSVIKYILKAILFNNLGRGEYETEYKYFSLGTYLYWVLSLAFIEYPCLFLNIIHWL